MLRGGAEARIIQDVLLEMLVKRAGGLKLECLGCRGERGFGASEDFKQQSRRLRRASCGRGCRRGPCVVGSGRIRGGLGRRVRGLRA